MNCCAVKSVGNGIARSLWVVQTRAKYSFVCYAALEGSCVWMASCLNLHVPFVRYQVEEKDKSLRELRGEIASLKEQNEQSLNKVMHREEALQRLQAQQKDCVDEVRYAVFWLCFCNVLVYCIVSVPYCCNVILYYAVL